MTINKNVLKTVNLYPTNPSKSPGNKVHLALLNDVIKMGRTIKLESYLIFFLILCIFLNDQIS